MEFSQAWIALIGTIFGGAGFKFIEAWLNRSQKKEDIAFKMREELRSEKDSLLKEMAVYKEDLRNAEKQLDEWRIKYFDIYQQLIELKSQLSEALRQAQDEHSNDKE